jgi:hypothetical protein
LELEPEVTEEMREPVVAQAEAAQAVEHQWFIMVELFYLPQPAAAAAVVVETTAMAQAEEEATRTAA